LPCFRRASRHRRRIDADPAAIMRAGSGGGQVERAERVRIAVVAEPVGSMHEGRRRNPLMAIALAVMLPGAAVAVEHDVVPLRELSPLAARDQVAHRLLSPLARREYERVVAGMDQRVRDQDIATGEERYDVFVPEAAADGAPMGVLVYIP